MNKKIALSMAAVLSFTFLIAVSSCYSDAPDSGDNTSGGDTPVATEFSITVSAPTYSGKTLSLASETSGTTTTFTVDSGYESYNWYYDGTLYSSTGNTWALDRSGSSPKVTTGSHQILVIVKETGMSNSYSATCTYTYKVSE